MTSAFVNRILMVVPILIAATTANAEAADVPASISQIKAIAGEEAQNYERLLVRASPIVRKACEQQPWAEMEKALNTAGLKPALMEDHGYYAEYRCVLLPSLSTAKGGIKMDLYLQMSVSSGRSQPTYEAPPRHTVTQALIGLSAMVGANQEQGRKEQWFGERSVIQESLASWPVTDAQSAFPVLGNIELSFKPSEDIGPHGNGDKFHIFCNSSKLATTSNINCGLNVPLSPHKQRNPTARLTAGCDAKFCRRAPL